ncbi:MAG: hypothetical protein ABWK00_01130 [Desulfurococcaceae archaeon]
MADEDLVKALLGLDKLEKIVMEYFFKNVSVGEVIALIELKDELRRRQRSGELTIAAGSDEEAAIERELRKAIANLMRLGLLEYRLGSYNLSQSLREYVKRKLGKLEPGTSKDLMKLLS